MKKFFLLFIPVLAIACFSHKKNENKLDLFYTLNYKGDNWSNHRTALLWTLSYLGAELPKNSLEQAITWKDSVTFNLNFEKLGFSDAAQEVLKVICDSLKETTYYKNYCRIDLGHFITITVGSSWHYYKITGVPGTLGDFYKLKNFKNHKTFALTKSAVAHHHRLIKYASGSERPVDWLFVAEEGEGDLTTGTFSTSVYEVFDLMPNGQLRFGIYDKGGNLIAASPKNLGEAGKPAKCLWCHEIVIQNLFTRADTVPHFVSPKQFQEDMVAAMAVLRGYRNKLGSDLSFKQTQDHTQMEIAYISYMQPSLKRLAQEWKLSPSEVEVIVGSINKQSHHEFKFLEGIMFRQDIKTEYKILLPGDIREPSSKEPDYFNSRH